VVPHTQVTFIIHRSAIADLENPFAISPINGVTSSIVKCTMLFQIGDWRWLSARTDRVSQMPAPFVWRMANASSIRVRQETSLSNPIRQFSIKETSMRIAGFLLFCRHYSDCDKLHDLPHAIQVELQEKTVAVSRALLI